MAGRKAVVIAVDGLRASALGAYGNTWHATTALDALAAEAVVVEHMWTPSPDLSDFYKAAWNDGALLRELVAAGVRVQLVTDDASVAAWGDAMGGTEAWALEPIAQDVAETALARLFALATERLESWTTPAGETSALLWIHARGWHGAWDAPLELRAALLDNEDPEPPTFATPPARVATEDHDQLLGFRAAYAAQTLVLDECVGGLHAVLDELGIAEETHVALVGCRGFALGEHGAVGGEVRSLYGEVLHVPCLLRPAGLAPAPPRWAGLATPHDLHATLASWFGLPATPLQLVEDATVLTGEGAATSRRQFVTATGEGGERAFRTRSWMLRRPPRPDIHGTAAPVELYAKPDDRWEANEVADRCGDVAERLLAALEGAPSIGQPGALDDDLV